MRTLAWPMEAIGRMPMTRIHITHKSNNKKTGKITVTRVTTNTCPGSCPLKGDGCYDEGGNGRIHRDRHDRGEYASMSFDEFLVAILGGTQVVTPVETRGGRGPVR